MSKRVILAVGVIIYFIFGFYHLTDFISSDEHFWLPNSGTERIEDYWSAIENRNWSDTRINDKPGVTLAYIPGLVYFFEDAKGQVKTDGKAKIFNPDKTYEINLLYRLPILIFSGLFSIFLFWIIKKITEDEWIALWSAILVLLSPILLGMSQIVNPDSLFWIFSTASMLTFFHYLQKGNSKFAWLAGILFGLTMASKYTGIILIPFFLLMMLAYYLFDFENWKNKAEVFSGKTVKNGLAYLLIILGGLAIFAALMPALIVDPKLFYESTIGFPGMAPIFWLAMIINAAVITDGYFFKSRFLAYIYKKLFFLKKVLPFLIYLILTATFLFILINWLARNSLLDLSRIPYDLKRSDEFSALPLASRFIMEALPMVFSLVPFTLFLLFYLWIHALFKKSKHSLLIFILSLFIVVFYAATIKQGLLLTIRYGIMLYPLAMILSAISIRELFSQNKKEAEKNGKDWPLIIFSWLLSGMAVFQGLSLYFQSLAKKEQDKINISYYSIKEYLFFGAILAIIYISYKIIYTILNSDKIRNLNRIYISLIIIGLSVISLWLIKPFYFNYTNDLLPKKYIITAAWGYGGYEAAQYVNSLPDAKNLTVWADMYGFCEFFVGRCIHAQKINVNKYKIDYYYITTKGSISPLFPHPMEKKSAWELRIDGRKKNYLKIIKALPVDPKMLDVNYIDSPIIDTESDE